CPSSTPRNWCGSSRPIRGKATLTTVESRKTAPEPRTTAISVPRREFTSGVSHELDLYDWRRRVADLYRLPSLDAFRAGRDALFKTHPQSPIPPDERESCSGLRYFA